MAYAYILSALQFLSISKSAFHCKVRYEKSRSIDPVEVVRLAVGHAKFDSAARHPDREATAMMVAPRQEGLPFPPEASIAASFSSIEVARKSEFGKVASTFCSNFDWLGRDELRA